MLCDVADTCQRDTLACFVMSLIRVGGGRFFGRYFGVDLSDLEFQLQLRPSVSDTCPGINSEHSGGIVVSTLVGRSLNQWFNSQYEH